MLGAGMCTDEIPAEHTELEKEDVRACLNYTKLTVSGHSLGDVA